MVVAEAMSAPLLSFSGISFPERLGFWRFGRAWGIFYFEKTPSEIPHTYIVGLQYRCGQVF